MTGALHGKVALITGAGAGIGAGLARRFAYEGARVVVAEYDAVADEKAAAISDPGPGSPPSLNHEVQQRGGEHHGH